MNEPTVQGFLIFDYASLEELIIESYANCSDFSIHADQEAGRHLIEFNGIDDSIFDDYDTNRMINFVLNGSAGNYMLRAILKDLCQRELIPPGNYLVDCR